LEESPSKDTEIIKIPITKFQISNKFQLPNDQNTFKTSPPLAGGDEGEGE
jgi:hypothetical protein